MLFFFLPSKKHWGTLLSAVGPLSSCQANAFSEAWRLKDRYWYLSKDVCCFSKNILLSISLENTQELNLLLAMWPGTPAVLVSPPPDTLQGSPELFDGDTKAQTW